MPVVASRQLLLEATSVPLTVLPSETHDSLDIDRNGTGIRHAHPKHRHTMGSWRETLRTIPIVVPSLLYKPNLSDMRRDNTLWFLGMKIATTTQSLRMVANS